MTNYLWLVVVFSYIDLLLNYIDLLLTISQYDIIFDVEEIYNRGSFSLYMVQYSSIVEYHYNAVLHNMILHIVR